MEKVLSSLFILISSFFIRGFVIFKIWEWYAVAIFNMISLTYMQAVGVGIFLSFIINKIPNYEDAEKIDIINQFIFGIVVQAIYLLIAFLVHLAI